YGYRKIEVLTPPNFVSDYSNYFTRTIDQRTTTITRVYRGICLYDLESATSRIVAHRTDDSRGHSALQSQRTSHCQDGLPHLHIVRITQHHCRQIKPWDLDDGEILSSIE